MKWIEWVLFRLRELIGRPQSPRNIGDTIEQPSFWWPRMGIGTSSRQLFWPDEIVVVRLAMVVGLFEEDHMNARARVVKCRPWWGSGGYSVIIVPDHPTMKEWEAWWEANFSIIDASAITRINIIDRMAELDS